MNSKTRTTLGVLGIIFLLALIIWRFYWVKKTYENEPALKPESERMEVKGKKNNFCFSEKQLEIVI